MSNAVARKVLTVGAGGAAAGALALTLNGPAAYLASGGSNLALLANTVPGGGLALQASQPPGGAGGGAGLTVQAGTGNVGVGTAAPAAALDVANAALRPSLVAQYLVGPSLAEASGAGLFGPLSNVGGLAYVSGPSAVGVVGMAFPAAGTYAEVGVGGVFTTPFAAPLTVCAWATLYATSATSNQTLVNVGQGDALTLAYAPALGGVALLVNGAWASAAFPVATSNWTHFAAAYSASTSNASFYANGALVSSATVGAGAPLADGSRLRVGDDLGLGAPLLGALADVRVYGRALAPLEVAQVAAGSPSVLRVGGVGGGGATLAGPLAIAVPGVYVASSSAPSVVGAGLASVGVASNLVAWMPFDGTLADVAGGVNANLTVAGTGAVTYVQGPFGPGSRAVNVMNTSTTVTVCLTSPVPPPTTFSLAVWICPTSTSAFRIFVTSMGGASTNNIWASYNAASANINFGFWGGTNFVTNTTYAINTWIHVVVTYTPGVGLTLFVNGVLQGYIQGTTGVITGLTLGGSAVGQTDAFLGYLADVRVYAVALTSVDVAALVAAYPCQSLAGAVSYFPFDGTLTDVLGATALAANGTVAYVPGRVGGVAGKALYLANEANVLAGTAAANYVTSSYSPSVPFTVALWACLTQINATFNAIFITNNAASFLTNSLGIYYQTGFLLVTYYGGSGTTPFAVTKNTWFHVAVSVTSANTLVYANGVLVLTLSGTLASSGFMLGNQGTALATPFAGYIDDFRLYNRGLTALEVAALYAAGNAASCVLALPFTASLQDATGNATPVASTGAVGYSNVAAGAGSVYSAKLVNALSSNVKAANTVVATLALPTSNAVGQSQAATVCAWLFPLALPGAGQASAVWSAGMSTSATEALSLVVNASGQLQLTSSNATGAALVTAGSAATAVASNAWTHTAAVFDPAGSNALYVNGSLVALATSAAASNLAPSGLFVLGDSASAAVARPFSGLLDDVRVYNRVVPPGELALVAGASYPSGLVQWFTFDGSLANSVAGGATFTQTGLVTYVSGRCGAGSAISFNNDSTVNAGSGAVGNYITATYSAPSTYTVAVWMNSTAYYSGRDSLAFAMQPLGGGTVQIGRSTNNGWASVARSQAWIGTAVPYTTIPSMNNWVHMVATVNVSTNTISTYVNGAFSASQSTSFTVASATGFQLPCYDTTAACAFSGAFDELRIYNRVLSASEIAALYVLTGGPQPVAPMVPLAPGNLAPIAALPVAHYPFQRDVNDYAPFGASTLGATLLGAVAYAPGVAGSALVLGQAPGVTATVSVTYPFSLAAGQALSVSCWLSFASLPAGGTFSVPWLFGTASSEALQLIYAGSSGLYAADGGTVGATVPVTLNVWTHVAVTRGGNGLPLVLYVNGVPVVTTVAGSMVAATSLCVGTSTWYPARAFNGAIDDLRVYSRALLASEVATLFASTGALPLSAPSSAYAGSLLLPGLASWHRFEPPDATRDWTGNSNVLTLANTALGGVAKADTASLGFGSNVAGSNVAVATATVVHRTLPAANFTLAAWVCPQASNVAAGQTFWGVASGSVPVLSLTLASNLALQASVASSSNAVAGAYAQQTVPGPLLTSNAWAHVAAVQALASYGVGATLTLYVNGVSAGASALALPALPVPVAGAPFAMTLGATATGSNAFAGWLDDVRVYNRALLPADVAALVALYATTSNTPPLVATLGPAGLVSYLPLDGNVLDVASPGMSNVALTFGNAAAPGSNVRYVSPSPVGGSALYLSNVVPAVAQAQQTHVDVVLPTGALAGPLSVTAWLATPANALAGTVASCVYHVGSFANGSNGLALSLAPVAPVPWPPCGVPFASTSTSVTASVAGQAYGVGAYTASCSSVCDTRNGDKAFDGNATTYWYGDAGVTIYNSSGVYTGAQSTAGYAGEWVQIKLPQPIVLTSFTFLTNMGMGYMLKAYNLYGSTDGSTWSLLYSTANNQNAPGVTMVVPVTTSVAYAYYRLAVGSTNAYSPAIAELRFYGLPNQGASALALTVGCNVVPLNPLARAAAATVTPGAWTHTALTYDTSNVRLYVNGDTAVPLFQGYVAGAVAGATMARLGDVLSTGNTASAFAGYVSDWRLYGRVLAAGEIQALGQAQAAAAPPPASSLLGWWPFDGNVQDAGANGFHGVATGAVAFVAGVVGTSALSLVNVPGTFATGVVDLPVAVAGASTGGFALAAWLRPAAFADGAAPLLGSASTVFAVCGATGAPLGRALDLTLSSTGVPTVAFVDANGVADAATAAAPLAAGAWSHVVVAWTASTVSLYVNAALVASRQATPARAALYTRLRVGDAAAGGLAYAGAVDDLRWYNRALAPTEMAALVANRAQTLAAGVGLTVVGSASLTGGLTVGSNVGIGSGSPVEALDVVGYADPTSGVVAGAVSGAPYVAFDGSARNGALFLKWLRRVTAILAASPWSLAPAPAYSTATAAAGFYGGVNLVDGRVLLVPNGASTVGLFTPATNAYATGASATGYNGGVLLPDGRVLLVPRGATAVATYLPSTNTVTTYGSATGYCGGALMADGRVLLAPMTAGGVGVFSPSTNAFAVYGAGGTTGYAGAVPLPDGRVVLVPYNATTVGVFTPSTNAFATVSGPPGSAAYLGGVLLPDGRVAFVPATVGVSIGLFTPSTNAFTTLAVGSGSYAGGVLLPDGRVAFAPSNSANVGVFAPATNAFAAVTGATNPPGSGAYVGGVLLPDGRALFVPAAASTAGLFAGFPRPPPELGVHPCFNKL